MNNKSVTRRILALAIALPYAGVGVYLSIRGSLEAFIALGTLATAVVAFYFGAKAESL